jgi:DNA replication licensing factor MCM7
VYIVFGPQSKASIRTISELKSEDIGSLVIVKAIVVRSNAVKPEITVATYGCDVCGC